LTQPMVTVGMPDAGGEEGDRHEWLVVKRRPRSRWSTDVPTGLDKARA